MDSIAARLRLDPAEVRRRNLVQPQEMPYEAGILYRDGEPVRIQSPFGEARAYLRISERVGEGSAFLTFHFPETGTNALIGPVLDRLADCPEYKLTPIRVSPVP